VGRAVAQDGGGVRGVQHETRAAPAQRQRPCLEALELLTEERVTRLVGGGEVRHRARELDAVGGRHGLGHARGLCGVARPQAPHAGIELDVHAPAAAGRHGGHELLAPGDDIGSGGERRVELVGAHCAHDEQSGVDPGSAQRRRLAGGGHRQPRSTAGERRPGGLLGAVAVAVGLDHRAQLGAGGELAPQPCDIALDGGHVDPGQRPHCGHRSSRVSASASMSRTVRIIGAPSVESARTAAPR
jgi:hypothetical protein